MKQGFVSIAEQHFPSHSIMYYCVHVTYNILYGVFICAVSNVFHAVA